MHVSDELSLPCDDRDFAEWHQGCPWCAVWVVMLEAQSVAQAVALGRQKLGNELGAVLLPRYERQPHITVAYRGLCVAGDQHGAAEYGRLQLQQDLALLRAGGGADFSVQLKGVGSFTSVPYLVVQQGQAELLALHMALVPLEPAPDWRYVPHVTLGHYAVQLPLRQSLQALQGVGDGLPLLQVKKLSLVRYASADIAGPLVPEGVFDLATGHYQPASGALWPGMG